MRQDPRFSAKWLSRVDEEHPYDDWSPFPAEAIVQVKTACGSNAISQSKDVFWGYHEEEGCPGRGVAMYARRLDRPIQ